MATKLGKVGMTLGGEYDPTREYDKLTCVYHNGVSWVSRGIVPANNTPADGSNYWQKISARGEQGDKGETGIQGPQGVQGPQGLQGNSGYTGAASELEVVNNLTTDNALAALSAAQGKVVGDKLAQLDQEWQEIKDADFAINPNIEKVVLTESEVTLEPGKYYTWETPMAYLDIALIPPTQQNYVGKYIFSFTCPLNAPTYLNLPVGMVWNSNPDFKAGDTYLVFIYDNIAIFFADPKVETDFVTAEQVQAMIDATIVSSLNTPV